MDDTTFGTVSGRYATRAKLPAKDLLPIIPPGAKLAANTSIKQNQLGKIPGRYRKGEWMGLSGPWPTFGLPEHDQSQAQTWPTENVGLRATDYPAIDLDIDDPVIAKWAAKRVGELLGFAPKRVRGNSPRCLLVFKRGGDAPVRKKQLIFTYQDKQHKIEVLGAGQQYVIHGTHPSGVSYRWEEGANLADVSADGLQTVTDSDLVMCMERLAEEVEQRGATVDKLLIPTRAGTAGAEEHDYHELTPLAPPDLILSALRSFPNNDETLPSREGFVGIVAAFKSAMGNKADQYKDHFYGWATAEGWADVEYVDKIWDSTDFVRAAPDALFNTARKHGWRGDAMLDFGDLDTKEVEKKIRQLQADTMSEEEAAKQALADKLCYYAEAQKWIVIGTGEMLSHEALNKYPGLGTTISDAGATGRQTAANQLINANCVRQVSGVTYLPAREPLTSWATNGRSGLFYNRWYDAPVALPAKVSDEDVRPWLDHVAYLFPDEAERNIILDWLAHVVQKRGVKIRWAPLVLGGQGIGKDLMVKPVALFLNHNYEEVGPDRLFNQFNSYFEREMICVQEMVRNDRIEAYEKLKAILAGTAGDMIMIERKYENPYSVPNTTNFLFFSNHMDAVKLDAEDRRFFVIRSDAIPQSPAYYEALATDFYIGADGWQKVIRWLKQRDLSDFQTHQCPATTVAKQEMVDSQQPTLCRWLKQAVEDEGVWSDRTVLTANYVFNQTRENLSLPIKEQDRRDIHKPSQAASALKYVGWTRNPKATRVDGQVVCMWVRDPDKAGMDPIALREIYEAEKEQAKNG